jgi:hypothetical protein
VEARRDRGADGGLRSPTAGLIEELTEWFTARFDKIRELNFESCPGERRCETKPGARIYRFLKGNPEMEIEQICSGCNLKETKPGTEPEHLTQAISIANELEEDSLVCGGFDYPAILEYLDPFEYACLIAIKAARRASESKSMKEPQQQAQRSDQMEHLRRLSHGR